jgi:RNA polymerase sigma-70 factor (ECF subfamily)
VSTPNAQRFTEFYRAHHGAALRYVRFRAPDGDGEALVEDAFLLTWQHLVATGELRAGWFYQVLRNKIGDFYRSAKRGTVPVSPEQLPDDGSPYDLAASVARREDVRRVLRSLPEAHAEVLLLAFWCDLSGVEAARALGIREGAFRARLLRARKAFLTAYDSQAGPAPEAREGVMAWIALSD